MKGFVQIFVAVIATVRPCIRRDNEKYAYLNCKLLTKMCSWQPSWKQHYLQWSYPSEYKRYEFITISIEGSRVVSKAYPISYFTLLPVLLFLWPPWITFPSLHSQFVCTHCSFYLRLKVATRPPYLSRSAGQTCVNRLLFLTQAFSGQNGEASLGSK